jgi:hypothetical protein
MGCGSSRKVDVINYDEDGPKKKVEDAWTTEKIEKLDSHAVARNISKNDTVTPIEIQQLDERSPKNFVESTHEEPLEPIKDATEEMNLPNALLTRSQDMLLTTNMYYKSALNIPRPQSPLKPILKPPVLPTHNLSDSGKSVTYLRLITRILARISSFQKTKERQVQCSIC